MPDPLPDHTIRVNPRAKRAWLKVSPRDGLVVVLPKRFARRHVPEILRENRRWIDKQLAAVDEHRRTNDPTALPDRVSLQAIDRELTITYRRSDSAAVTARQRGANELRVTGAIDDVGLVHESLRRWLKRTGKAWLVPRLHELSDRLGLPLGRVRIGLPTTQWGSCTSRRAISLSAAILFLPPPLADYILIHELCHLKHPNHSRTFWSAVSKHVPNLPPHRPPHRTPPPPHPPRAEA